MILDERSEFADATALSTSGTGRAIIGDVMDSSVARDLGNGHPVFLVLQVTTACTSVGAATVSFELVSDAQAALATDGTATEHFVSEAIPVASLVAGYTRVIPLPPEGSAAYERYLGVLQNVATAALTAGAVNAFLTLDAARWKSHADAI